MPKPEKQKPEEGQNPLWPGEGLRKAGEVIEETERGEKTIIPEILNDGKRHDGTGNASPA
jgi:hypothetical protein